MELALSPAAGRPSRLPLGLRAAFAAGWLTAACAASLLAVAPMDLWVHSRLAVLAMLFGNLVSVAALLAALSSTLDRRNLALAALAALLSAVGVNLLGHFLTLADAPEAIALYGEDETWVFLFTCSLVLTWVHLTFGAIYAAFSQREQAQAQRRRFAEQEALARRAQLGMLRLQLNPHFLINTLNAVSGLVMEGKTAEADDMLMRLTRFLRYALAQEDAGLVSLAEELRASRLYLDIERLRLGDRLRLDIDVEDRALDGRLPALLLQPLIENAVKHDIAGKINGGDLIVSARCRERRLLIEVVNSSSAPGPAGEAAGTSMGVGQENVKRRLRLMYGQAACFQAGPDGDGSYRVCIDIPYEDGGM